jgi:hypothetical protein
MKQGRSGGKMYIYFETRSNGESGWGGSRARDKSVGLLVGYSYYLLTFDFLLSTSTSK